MLKRIELMSINELRDYSQIFSDMSIEISDLLVRLQLINDDTSPRLIYLLNKYISQGIEVREE